jgi:hypothetical protein
VCSSAKEAVESVQYRERGGGECTLVRKRRWRVYNIAKEAVGSVQYRERGGGECTVQ